MIRGSNTGKILTWAVDFLSNTPSCRMSETASRLAYIGQDELPSAAVIKSMLCTGGKTMMRDKMSASGWDKEELLLTPVSRLDQAGVITGTYWLLLGEPMKLSISARDLWPNCENLNLNLVLTLGDLSSYTFPDMSTTSSWVTSESLADNIQYVQGNLKRDITPGQAAEQGTGPFMARLHVLPEARATARVWISLLPGTKNSLDERLRGLLGNPTFPVLSFELSHKTRREKKSAALAPKSSNQKIGVYCTALIDSTMASQGGETPTVDPTSYLNALKGLVRKGVWPNKTANGGKPLKDKLASYLGDARFYTTANRKRQSYYATEAPTEEIAGTGELMMTCTLGGKYNGTHALRLGVMRSTTLPQHVTHEAQRLVSQSIAENTAKSYKSAQNILGPASSWLGKPIEVPFSTADTIALVVYMATVKSLRSSTISVYFAGFRMLHLIQGVNAPCLRTDIINQMIVGVKNGDRAADVLSDRKSRQPVTMDVMSKLQQSIKASNMPLRRKRLIWFTATSCLLGSFRIHEVLPVHRYSFDKTTTLMSEDVVKTTTVCEDKTVKTLSYHIKDPKENKSSHGIRVDIFENKGPLNWLCAVKSFEKYQQISGDRAPNQPLFKLQDGSGYTGKMFNEDIKTLLMGRIDQSLGPLTTHSFRAGMATMMAEAGCSDDQIQLAGRWSSDAFKLYVKTARPRRAIMAADIWNQLSACRILTNRQ